METLKQYCPICNTEIKFNPRYKNYVCYDCSEKASDKNGRKLIFGNEDMFGGCCAMYEDTKEDYNSSICDIEGIECTASEAKFGGIVIETKL